MRNANQFDVIRSFQKDQYYLNKQNTLIQNIINYFNNSNRDFNDEIDLLSDFFYYALTTLLNRQTLGQEAYNLILYNQSLKNVPSLFNRIIYLLTRSFIPYFFNKMINLKLADRSTSLNLKSYFLLAKMVLFYLKEIYKIKYFFNNNNFYDLDNKISNIKYLTLNTNQKINLNKYKFLGFLKGVTLIIFFGHKLKNLLCYIYKRNDNKNNIRPNESNLNNQNSLETQDNDIQSKSKITCLVCLENVINPTLTNCGHIFCWLCIQRYVNNFKKSSGSNKIACPNCRMHFDQNKLIYLHNYI